tara:strand:+ start:174 stop:671 length:498 start_codon:yes stop_codon:yes gene_type:complete
MKKVTNLKNENYFNMCGCSSSFEGNENSDNDNDLPRYSNAIGDASILDIDNENESGFQSNFDNFLNASKKKKKAQKITKEKVANALKNTKGVVDKASQVADALVKGGTKIPTEMGETPLEASDLVMGDAIVMGDAPKKNNMLKYVAIVGGIGLIAFIGYKFLYKK